MADNNCDLPLVAIENNNQNCDGNGNPLPTYGKQIPQIFYQDMRGDGEAADTALRGGATTAQGAMTETGNDQVFTLKNIAAGVVPESTDQTLTGNDVPFGATVITGRSRTVTGRIQYPTASTHAAVSQVTKHGLLRAWIVDEVGFVQGPIENATLNIGSFQRLGLGQAIPSHYAFTLSYDSVDEPAISETPLKYLHTLTNATTTPVTPGP